MVRRACKWVGGWVGGWVGVGGVGGAASAAARGAGQQLACTPTEPAPAQRAAAGAAPLPAQHQPQLQPSHCRPAPALPAAAAPGVVGQVAGGGAATPPLPPPQAAHGSRHQLRAGPHLMSTVKSRGMESPRARQGMVRRIQLMRPPALTPGLTSSPITCGWGGATVAGWVGCRRRAAAQVAAALRLQPRCTAAPLHGAPLPGPCSSPASEPLVSARGRTSAGAPSAARRRALGARAGRR